VQQLFQLLSFGSETPSAGADHNSLLMRGHIPRRRRTDDIIQRTGTSAADCVQRAKNPWCPSQKPPILRHACNERMCLCIKSSLHMLFKFAIPQRKIPVRDWSKSRYVTFTNTPQFHPQQQRIDILPSILLLTIVPSQRALFDWRRHHADAGHASLTFETSMSTPMPNSCIVAKQYVIRYQQTTMFTSFEESAKYYKFCV